MNPEQWLSLKWNGGSTMSDRWLNQSKIIQKVLRSYTYDTFGRLVKTVTTDYKKNDQTKTITYTYDNVGNRLKEDDGTTTTSYTYNGLDQLKTSTKKKELR